MTVARNSLLIAAWAAVALSLATVAPAVEPDEVLKDPALEARARKISAELRCLVCQNQSIDDSNAPLARDLRLIVRERLQAGDEDALVLSFIVARYGEFVLLRPRFGFNTLLLWLAPVALALGVLILLWRRGPWRPSRSSPPAVKPLTPAEESRLEEILSRKEP
jgi:cytochrome c-type biogenesis protein CcmH